MSTCIKTGAVLNILEPSWFSEIDRTPVADNKHIIYGDVHLVGTSIILYFPARQLCFWEERHGDIILPDKYFLRDRRDDDSILVLEVGYINFYGGALHPADRELFDAAKRCWANSQED